ncbi:MAG: HAD-IA family hydrolase [Chitinophagales bacterium]|nr:HAD-IA family hydrolase [Chitinophagales bacterium]
MNTSAFQDSLDTEQNIIGSISRGDIRVVLLAILVIALPFSLYYSYNLYRSGTFRKPYTATLISGMAIAFVVVAAIFFSNFTDVLLLLIPVVIYFHNKHLGKNRSEVKTINFINPRDLEYSNILYSIISEFCNSHNSSYKLNRIAFGVGTAITQNNAFKTSIKENPHVIILVANETNDDLFKNIKSAYQSNIPVILVDYPISTDDFVYNKISPVAHISSDFELGGKLAAKAMINLIDEKGNIIIISGPKNSESSEIRRKAFIGEIIEWAPDIHISYCGYVNDWTEDEARKVFRIAKHKLAEKKINIDGIFCCNDTLALGVLAELGDANIAVIGYDGIKGAIESIKRGKLAATIDVQINEQASAIIDEMKTALETPTVHIKNASKKKPIEPKIVENTVPKIKKRITNYKAILFDMDGLMLDNEKYQLESFNLALKSHDITLTDKDWNKYVGMSQKNIFLDIAKCFPEVKMDLQNLLSLKKTAYFGVIKNNLKPAKGLYTLLEYIYQHRELKCAIVSSSPRTDIMEIVQLLGIEKYFHEIVSAYDLDKPKPNKDCYLFACTELKVSPSECLVLEDSEVGILAAKAAKMECIAIPNEYSKHQNLSHTSHVLEDLEKIINFLDSNIS